MSQVVSSLKVNASKLPAKATVIFIHGLGDSGSGWSWFPQLVKQYNIVQQADSINYVFPNAPVVPVSVNFNQPMPSWFDIYEFGNPDARQDEEGFFKSCEVMKTLIKKEIEKGIPPEKVILGGFSQGAAVSLATASLLDFKIGGVVALSGFCPVRDALRQKFNKASPNFKTPIFQGHGTADPVINYEFGKLTSEYYKELGFENLTFHLYSGVAHSASEEELVDLMKFINEIVEK